MSVFGDFQRVWLQRFPNSLLPAAWEEDVRANLAKHKQKVAVLKEELEKEEFYVEYLERLLSDVEQHKRASKDSNKTIETKEINTLIEDHHDKVALSNQLSKQEKNEKTNIPEKKEPKGVVIENSQCSVNQCVSELSVSLTNDPVRRSNSSATQQPVQASEIDKSRRNTDPSNFVTVIEVNGLKGKHSNNEQNEYLNNAKKKIPPKPPLKKREYSLPETDNETPSSENARSKESLVSSTEQLNTEVVSHSDSLDSVSPDGDEEPYYDSVAGDLGEYVRIKGGRGSSTDDISSNASTLPMPAPRSHTSSLASVTLEPESPGKSSNYVNIEYFIKNRTGTGDTRSSSDGECDDDMNVPPLLRAISVDTEVQNEEVGSYASSSSLESATPSSKRKFMQDLDSKAEAERMTMYRCIITNIIESETVYVDCLSVMLQYMKAIKANLISSQSIISEDEHNTIFYKIPELYSLHSEFLEQLKKRTKLWDGYIGDCFKLMASNLMLYGSYLHNYANATDTVRKCCANNAQFSEIAKHMKCRYVSGQSISLEDLLHKPVARVQKNALVLHDLLKYTLPSHPDYRALSEALAMTQDFLDEFNQIQTKSMFPATDRAQRRLVKNSFIVELADGQRKLRHLFLFNDVIACAKYKVSSGRNERYTFELKWFIPLNDIIVLKETDTEPRENSPANIVSLKSQACTVRDQILLEERAAAEDKRVRLGSRSEKNRKKLAELEGQLVLASPNLVFRILNKTLQRPQVFFLSSEFERMQWIESIHALKMSCTPPAPTAAVSMLELQTWITACRTFLKTNMGSYLLRSGRDESLLVGDLHVTIKDLLGLDTPQDLFVCIEIDFYGHFFRKAKSKLICKSKTPIWNETFVIDLEGSENLRLLVYQDTEPSPTLFAKHTQKLSRTWLGEKAIEKSIEVNAYIFNMTLKFVPSEVTLRRVPTAKPGALFGAKILQVCKRQKRDIPFIITACVREVERRGMAEVGIYRVSGSASDLSKMKKSFESNSYEAEQLLKEVDIHSVTGILKLYLRELPEALFTDTLYPQLSEAYNASNGNPLRRLTLLQECFAKLPDQNQHCIHFLLEHLIKVHRHEVENKMSLHNLATVFGPTLLRPGGKADSFKSRDMLAAGTVDVMAQAGILYCFLEHLARK